MKKFNLPIVLLAAVSVLSFTSCNGKEQSGPAQVTKTNITFLSGRYADGRLKPVVLQESDEVALLHAASGEKSVSTPLTPGSNSSLFLFDLKKPKKGDQLAAWFPANSGFTVDASSASFEFPARQDGSEFPNVFFGSTKNTGDNYAGNSIKLNPVCALILAKVSKGGYSVTRAVLKANGGENIAGTVTINLESGQFSCTQPSITMEPPQQIDCSAGNGIIPIFVPPVELSKGFSIEFTLSTGKVITYSNEESLKLSPGSLVDTDPLSANRSLIACGSNKVYVFDEALAKKNGRYNNALTWSWDAKAAAGTVGMSASRMDHIDDAKPVADGKKFLVTSSYGWALLLNKDTKTVEWSSNGTTNAHSAELLPSERIVVACSDGGDAVKLFSSSSSAELASYPLQSAHGVVWSEKHQRLFAIGGTSLQIYSLKNWDSASPSLSLESTVNTKSFVTGLHDMTLADENTLIIGGNKAALYDISSKSLKQLGHFNSYQGVKSVNYNPDTGEAYYTYAWKGHSEGDYDWSSHKVRYTDDIFANDGGVDKSTIEVADINMYKVRVLNW